MELPNARRSVAKGASSVELSFLHIMQGIADNLLSNVAANEGGILFLSLIGRVLETGAWKPCTYTDTFLEDLDKKMPEGWRTEKSQAFSGSERNISVDVKEALSESTDNSLAHHITIESEVERSDVGPENTTIDPNTVFSEDFLPPTSSIPVDDGGSNIGTEDNQHRLNSASPFAAI